MVLLGTLTGEGLMGETDEISELLLLLLHRGFEDVGLFSLLLYSLVNWWCKYM